MPAFLLFTLYAPLAAFGDIAVGERRTGLDRPGRSGVFGLLAAALGIDRADEDGHRALDAAYALAVRVDRHGTLTQDYHTIQAPAARTGRSWATRRAALAERDLGTLLSLRDYRQDALSTLALLPRTADADTARLAGALATPRYTLFAGRKSCPLGLPPRPMVVAAGGLAAAFAAYDGAATEPERAVRAHFATHPAGSTIHVDRDFEAAGLLGDFLPIRIERRRDQVASRGRRQFTLREELVLLPAGSPS
ncbi:type I-E CRISPR-associated protein Cas5/CasD [Allostella vacuolata]|nr:type I-E CRISPR-associated protein Cas5/CasD [Stella vacuolata]